MAIENLNQFLQDYFTAHDCSLLHNQDGVLTVQLTEAMDRKLMNRPFYWHYVKKTGFMGEPKQLTLITNPDKREEEGEWIHFGSPRLQQIFQHLRTAEMHTKLFQQIETTKKTALYPWLVINMKISYIGKQKKDEMISIGLQLVNGMMQRNMMDHLQDIPLQTAISDYCFTLSPLIKLRSGFLRIESVIDDHIQAQPTEWAVESANTLIEEVNMLRHFYPNEANDEEISKQMEKELQEINDRYEPKIAHQVINGGLFYLAQDAMQ